MLDAWFIDVRPEKEVLHVLEGLAPRSCATVESLTRRSGGRQEAIGDSPSRSCEHADSTLPRFFSSLVGIMDRKHEHFAVVEANFASHNKGFDE
jgi:hypothetical protein